MKKCPKCGTILDDSKKKCYMCGADLMKNSITNFGESFDEQIGATVTKSQDNVFSNVENISTKVDDVFSKNDNAVFTQSSSSADFYKNQINGLNSMQYDERTALEKIFSGDARFRSKDEINATEAMKQNKSDSSKDFINGNDFEKKAVAPKPKTGLDPELPTASVQRKPEINWGNNLSSNNDVSGYQDKVSKKFPFNLSFIVNTLCFLLFLCGMGYLYFHYIKPEKAKVTQFGGLNYTINSDFTLKTDDHYSKYYSRGDNCSIRVSYGYTNDVSNYVDDYFEQIKDEFTEEKGYTSITEDMRINDNMWHSLSIMQLTENAAGTGGYSPNIKFKYVSIVYKGSFYNITYSNTRYDNECSAGFDQFIQTLAFD